MENEDLPEYIPSNVARNKAKAMSRGGGSEQDKPTDTKECFSCHLPILGKIFQPSSSSASSCSKDDASLPKTTSNPVEHFIRNFIQSNPIVIFSKTSCGYCTIAKDVLHKCGAQYQCIELDKGTASGDMARELEKLTGVKTVPQVFIEGEYIGGGQEVQKLYRCGRLMEMLANMKPRCHNYDSDNNFEDFFSEEEH